MKAKKFFILLAVVVGILHNSTWGAEPLIEKDYGGVLIGRDNPTLAGIEQLAVVIETSGAEPNTARLVQTEIGAKAAERLNKAGIKVLAGVAGNILNIIELRLDIDMLKLADSQRSVLHIQTSLSRAVCLTGEQRFSFKADVWNTEPVMLAVSAENMSEKITSVVLEQIEAFIHAYLAANSKGADSAKSKDVSTTYQKKVAPVVKPVTAEYQYVASKNSKVFHRPGCSSVGRIKPENRVFYSSRNQAIQDGKRPCKLCNP